MKRLVGGDYLLDLSSIELEESEDGSTKTNITDSDVLEQLTNLKKYISNPEMAKPVWVKLKNGENDELVIARGTFAVVDTGEFEICVQLDGYKLVIFIEFTQVLNSDDEPLDDWYIDTNDAKYLFTSDAQNVKATIEDANFGDVALAGDLSVGGDASVTGDLSVTGSINGEENPSIKPIYCHPLTIYTGNVDIVIANENYSLLATAMIFNNDDEEIDTFAKLVDASKSFHRLQVNGVLYNKTQNVAVEIVQIYTDEESARPVGIALNDGTRIDETSSYYDLFGKNINVTDGVNKIN